MMAIQTKPEERIVHAADPYAIQQGLIPREICDTLIRAFGNTLKKGRVKSGKKFLIDGSIRTGKVAWLTPYNSEGKHLPSENLATDLAFTYINGFAQIAAHSTLNYIPIDHPDTETCMQLAQYGSGQRYKWHVDSDMTFDVQRSMSIVVNLKDRCPSDGGHFEIRQPMNEDAKEALMQAGTAIAFPSWIHHRVTKVTGRQRWSLTYWCRQRDWNYEYPGTGQKIPTNRIPTMWQE